MQMNLVLDRHQETAMAPSETNISILDDILVVLVLYRRELAKTESFVSVSRSLEACGGRLTLFVYDNSPVPMFMDNCVHTNWTILYRHDPSNPGVSKAYNEGCKVAGSMGKKWLLLLDQDTEFPEKAVATYASAIETYPGEKLFAPRLLAGGRIYSPCGYRTGFPWHLSTAAPGMMPLAGRAFLNSGILISLELYAACGGYNEQVGLDFADFTFIRRLRHQVASARLLDLDCFHGFADSQAENLEQAALRFSRYCHDGRASAETVTLRVSHALVVLRRAVCLVVRYRDCCFLKTLVKEFLCSPSSGSLSRSGFE